MFPSGPQPGGQHGGAGCGCGSCEHPSPLLLQNSPLDLIDTGKGLKVQTEKPHLVSLGSGRLSTAITLLPLEEGECWLGGVAHGHAGGRDAEPPSLPAGRTTIGTAARDIVLQGPGLAPQHCYIENVRGTLTLHPCGNACAIDGVPLRRPTRLTQGERERDAAFAGGVVPPASRVFVDPSCKCTSQRGCSCLFAAGWGLSWFWLGQSAPAPFGKGLSRV